jgi:Tfp pilus assembly protein PilV
MNIRKSQSGFSPVEVLLAVVVIGLLGFGLFTVYNRQQEQTSTNNSPAVSQQKTASDTAPEINSTEDLTKAEKALDETTVDSASDNAQLDSQLSAF